MLIHLLIGELMKSVKTDMAPDPTITDTAIPIDLPPLAGPVPQTAQPGPSPESQPTQEPIDYTYPCFIPEILTGLLFSYESCKVAFLSYTPKKRNETPAKEGVKHRTAAIQFLLRKTPRRILRNSC